MSDVAVVLPVRDGASLLAGCLAALLPAAKGAELVLVDDGSTDETTAVAEAAGVRVVRTSGVGPYAARNAGIAATAAPVLAFVDVRSRPRPGWLSALVAPLVDPAVAVVGGEVVAAPGRTVAERYVGSRQPLSARHAVAHPFLPYAPTCNLAARRATVEQVGGFAAVRSGGDLDLCWRVQLAGLGGVRLAPDAVVDWVARRSARELLRQWSRYGAARAELLARFTSDGAVLDPPPGRWSLTKRELRSLERGLRTTPPRCWDVELLDRLCTVVWERSYRRAYRTLGVG